MPTRPVPLLLAALLALALAAAPALASPGPGGGHQVSGGRGSSGSGSGREGSDDHSAPEAAPPVRDGRPVLIDLGLARPVGQAPGRHRRGSPPWMTPDQVRRQPASPGMDLFALGAVLFELATGTQAFDPADDGPPGRRWPQLAGPPPLASGRNPEVPAPLDQALAALLAADPSDRAPGRLAGLPHGASPAGSTTCVAIAGGAQMLLARMVASGKTPLAPGMAPEQPSWEPGGGRGRVRALTRRRAPTGAPNHG